MRRGSFIKVGDFRFFADAAGKINTSLLVNSTPDIFRQGDQAVAFIPPGHAVHLYRQTHGAAGDIKHQDAPIFVIIKDLKVHHNLQFVDQPFPCTLGLIKCLAADDLAGPFVRDAKNQHAAATVGKSAANLGRFV